MATPGRPLDSETVARIGRMLASGFSWERIAAALEISKRTVMKYAKLLQSKPKGP